MSLAQLKSSPSHTFTNVLQLHSRHLRPHRIALPAGRSGHRGGRSGPISDGGALYRPHDHPADTRGKSQACSGRVQCGHYRVTANFAAMSDGTTGGLSVRDGERAPMVNWRSREGGFRARDVEGRGVPVPYRCVWGGGMATHLFGGR